ncbi:MAG: hypothetical protein BWY62_00360 [Firmicutes bacterium ADurb.Bin356]|nr:MAG: hypothetical protein BWY62_00360 [Firmicutes bacterium ADurb.Bin356]
MPKPKSCTLSAALPLLCSAVSIISLPPSFENFIALSIRLRSTCASCSLSPSTLHLGFKSFSSTWSFFWFILASKVTSVRRASSLRSNCCSFSGTWPLSMRARLSKSFTISVMRCVSVTTSARYSTCLSLGIVPSCIASRKPLIEVSGERSSWLTFATKLRRSLSKSLSSPAIVLKLLASWATSSSPCAFSLRSKSPFE